MVALLVWDRIQLLQCNDWTTEHIVGLLVLDHWLAVAPQYKYIDDERTQTLRQLYYLSALMQSYALKYFVFVFVLIWIYICVNWWVNCWRTEQVICTCNETAPSQFVLLHKHLKVSKTKRENSFIYFYCIFNLTCKVHSFGPQFQIFQNGVYLSHNPLDKC